MGNEIRTRRYAMEKIIWDKLSARFDTERNKKYFATCLSLLKKNIPNGASILDVGCGTGEYVITLHELGYNIKGFDYSEKMIEKAKEKNSELFRVGDAQKEIPFNETFDYAISMDSWEFFPDPFAVLKNLHGKLSKNGFFIIVTPNPLFAPPIIIAEKLRLKKLSPAFMYFNSFESKVKNICQNAGFDFVKKEWLFYYLSQAFFLQKTILPSR